MNHTDKNAPETLEGERFKSLINSMSDGVLAIDKQMRVALYNGAVLDVLDVNISIDDQPIDRLVSLIDEHDQPIDVRELIASCTSSQTFRNYRLHYSDGSAINLFLSIAPVRLGFGKHGNQGYVILARDITREKSLEEERDEFISVVSHELRTPIAIAEGNISNALYAAEHASNSAFVLKALKDAHTQVLFLADMMNDLATLSRAERGKLALDKADFNVVDLLKELADAYRAEIGAKGLMLTTDIDPELAPLCSNRLYVREILQNLVTNAIKYTESGTIAIEAKQHKRFVTISVRDSGIGISKPDQAKIYDKFFRSEDYRTRSHGGTGLGLYVVMKLLRIVKGDITLQSQLNKGSTFTVTFPDLK